MHKYLLSVVLGFLWVSLTLAQPATAPKKPAAAPARPAAGPAQPAAAEWKDAIRKASQAYVAALNAGDFKAAAAFWTADGKYVDQRGNGVLARQLVAEELPKKYADKKKPQLALEVRSVQLLTPTVAQEEGTVEVKTVQGNRIPRGRFNTLWVKQQNKWLIKSTHEKGSAAIEHTHQLADLAWLVGSWEGKLDGDDIYFDCHWSANKAYLFRDITIAHDGKVKHSVAQRIGLDPLSPKIKSWSHDADGGLSEAFWDKIGDSWYVTSRGASSGGEITTARNVYTDIGPDSFTLESGEAHFGGETLTALNLKFSRDTSLEATTAANPTADPPPAGSASNGTDSQEKEKILSSPQWRATQQAYQEWLSVQKIYSPAEVKQLKSETAAKVAKMSAAQLRTFLEDAHEKVAILMSQPTQDARAWLAQRMAVEVKLTPEQIKKQRPDVANMTSAQLEQWLTEIEQNRSQTQQAQQNFNASRQSRIQSINEQQQQADREREQGLNRAAEDSGYGAYYGGYGGYSGYGGYRW